MKTIVPISGVFGNVLPSEWIAPLSNALSFVGVNIESSHFVWDNTGMSTHFEIHILEQIQFDFPLIPGSTIEFEGDDSGIIVEIKTSPVFQVTIRDITFTLSFASDILRAYTNEGSRWIEVRGEDDEDVGFSLTLTLPELKAGAEGNIHFETPEISLDNDAFMISDTGVLLDFSQDPAADASEPPFQLIFDGVPENLRESLPENFKGVWIKRLSIFYIKEGADLPSLTFERAAFGTGGFSGIIGLGSNENADRTFTEAELTALETNADGIWTGEIAGMRVILLCFNIEFFQSIPTASRLAGYIFMPFADKWMRLEANIGGPNGDFMLELGGTSDEGLINLETDFFRITADSIAYLLRDGVNYVIISGSIQLLQPPLDWPEFNVDRISIGSDGSIDIEGGWVEMPEALTLDLGGFRVSISAFGMGNEGEAQERQWVGFSGEVQLMEGLPIRGAVEGLKISWNKNGPGDVQVSLEGVEVDLTIPGTLSFIGRVSLDRETNLFRGHIQLNLISLRMEMEASLMVGKVRNEAGIEFSVFYIYLGISLPSAIPLGATGTGLYGLAGLFGYNVAPTKTTEQNWYDWYKADPEYDVTSLNKWAPLYDNLAFGVGVTLGTIYDDGTTINLSAMLVVLIPGPVIILEGKANILQPRSNDRTAEGNFYLLAVLDCRAGTFQLNIDIRYSLEDIVSVGGSIEAYFDFNNDQNWYIYIGRKEPENKRIFADILSLFRASVYFMIDPRSLQFGASVGLNIDETWGPLALRLIIRLSVDAAIFFKPFQLEGRLELLIDLAVSVFGIGIRIMLQAILEGKSPNPFWIHGVARATIGLFFPLPSFDVSVEFTWQAGVPTLPEWPLLKQDEDDHDKKHVYLLHHKSTEYKQALLHSTVVTAIDFSTAPIVPVDVRPSITFAKNIHNLKKSDGSPLLDISPDVIGDYVFEYKLTDLYLEKFTKDGWVTIRNGVNKSNIPNVLPFTITNDINYSSFTNGVDAREPILDLWRTGAMDNRNSYERETYTDANKPCPSVPAIIPNIVNWFDEPIGLAYAIVFLFKDLLFIADFVPEVIINAPITSKFPFVGTCAPLIKNSGAKALRITNCSIRFEQKIVSAEIRIAIGIEDGNPTINSLRAKFYRDGRQVPTTAAFTMRAEQGVNMFYLKFENNVGVDSIRLEETGTTDKAFWLYSILYTTYEQYVTASAATGDPSPAISNSNIGPDLILEPDMLYRLIIFTGVTSNTATDTFYFKTDKGPGMIASDSPEAKSTVRQLSTYISDSYPATGATNHYFGYNIGIGFNETYVKKLYKYIPSLRLKDRNGNYIGSDGNKLLRGIWMKGFMPLINSGLFTWLQAKQQSGCLVPEPSKSLEPLLSFSAPNDLKPNSLYIAELVGTDNGTDYILYTFQFTTSRYKNFTSHFTGLTGSSTATTHKLPSLNRDLLLPGTVNRVTLRATVPISEKTNLFELQRTALKSTAGYISHTRTFNKTQVIHEELTVINTECFDDLYQCVISSFEAIGMVNRPVPPGVEFLQIPISGSDSSIVLIESPEPVAWSRIHGTITYNSATSNIGFIWNGDQTKAFIRIENTIGLNKGQHLLRLTFEAQPDFTSSLYRRSSGSEDFLEERVTLNLILT